MIDSSVSYRQIWTNLLVRNSGKRQSLATPGSPEGQQNLLTPKLGSPHHGRTRSGFGRERGASELGSLRSKLCSRKAGFLVLDLLLASIISTTNIALAETAHSNAGAAQATGSVCHQVLVNVRTLRAVERFDRTPNPGVVAVKIDSRLQDLSSKLRELPFKNFSLLSTEERTIPLKKRETLSLGGGQTLTLRPLYADNDRVGMWLKWKEPDGSDILDTRMHFNFGESMIAGTDNSPSSGVILVIDVQRGADPILKQ